MSLWSLNRPPLWTQKSKEYKNDSIVLTQAGWTVLRTGEVIVAMGNRQTDAGVSDIVDVKFSASSYDQGDPVTVVLTFNEKVDVTAGAAIQVSWSGVGGNFSCTVPSNLTAVNEVQFTGTIPSEPGTLSLLSGAVVTGTIVDTGTLNASNKSIPSYLEEFFESIVVA